MDTSGLQSKIQQLQDEHPIIRLNRWFATHLQNELNGFLVNCMKEIVSAFEEEWDFALSDEGKTGLMMGMDVRVEVNGVPFGSPFSWVDQHLVKLFVRHPLNLCTQYKTRFECCCLKCCLMSSPLYMEINNDRRLAISLNLVGLYWY